ncbi:MAG TPA: hypothetical protein VF534_31150 [Paraburkholderia sp.]
MDGQIVAAMVAVGGTLGGSVIGWLSQRDAKALARLEQLSTKYANEIRARQAEEDIACKWLIELNAASSLLAAKRQLRDRTELERGLRPIISPAEVSPRI